MPARYDACAAAIRQEFIHVGDDDCRASRVNMLRQFVERSVMYPDPGFAVTIDCRARDLEAQTSRFIFCESVIRPQRAITALSLHRKTSYISGGYLS